MTKRLFVIVLCIIGLAWTPSLYAKDSSSEYLVVNNPRVKKFKFKIGNVTVGNASVVNFKADRKKNRITLFPRQAGSTTLLVYDKNGKQQAVLSLKVYPSDPNKLLEEVRQLLVDVEGVTIKRVESKIIIDGELLLPDDKKRIRKVSANSRQIIDYTKMSPSTSRIVAKKIQKEIGMDEVNVRSVKGQILLEGEVYSPMARKKALKIASLYADRVIDALEVRLASSPPVRADTVEVTAHFVEVAKNFSRNFNFRWNPIPRVGTSLSYTINPVTGSDNFTGAITGTANDLLPKLNYFKTLGIARVLENPTVSVKSGEKAVIESGTKVGFPIVQPNGAVALQFQNVGATLEIEPKTLGTDIDMDVVVKISSLGSPQVNGGVAIQENSVTTSQIVRSGESVVIGGLVRHSNRQALDRPPVQTGGGESSMPSAAGSGFTDPFPMGSLFTLFKSNDVSKQRSQFLIFITPKILKYSKDANRNLKEQFNLFEVYPEALNQEQGGSPTN